MVRRVRPSPADALTDPRKVRRKTASGRVIYDSSMAEEARKLALLGATNEQMGAFFGVSETCFTSWMEAHAELTEAIKNGRERADTKVAESLYGRACGYSHMEEKIFIHQGEVIRVPVVKHYPPDTASMIWWLKNRRPDLWREKVINEHTGLDGGPIQFENMSDQELDRYIEQLTEENRASEGLLGETPSTH